MATTIESIFCDKLEDANKSYVESLSNLNDMEPSKIQQNFNDTLKSVLNQYLKADFTWIGATTSTPPVVDSYTGDSGLSVTFATIDAFIGVGKVAPETTFDANLTVNIKAGLINLPATTTPPCAFAPPVISLATGIPGIITTDFPSAADGIDWSKPESFSEDNYRKIREKAYKQIFDCIIQKFTPTPMPATRTGDMAYVGTATVTQLYYDT